MDRPSPQYCAERCAEAVPIPSSNPAMRFQRHPIPFAPLAGTRTLGKGIENDGSPPSTLPDVTYHPKCHAPPLSRLDLKGYNAPGVITFFRNAGPSSTLRVRELPIQRLRYRSDLSKVTLAKLSKALGKPPIGHRQMARIVVGLSPMLHLSGNTIARR
ncbi:hypothetical protein CCHR01_12513 [Colletotrichum chrysophilum]|uniref:Uncharacterized protein n=1 Tax=Colletotrichum chrysophilum TaxID=1836956 RepID=A0AAD9EBB5_9PEZI|nr:hypothetical protein CCHR01_12513 [Colletotrichum chrysophilum]